ncbi:helix-turn-helix domain-containing protein [Nonomuraea phyllanthi]|uniref:Helix-turn-helix domain-containing protein n=1 Tax=Nonomuraea phyllanthi TaxID=2219224 RepID=A0A5C4WS43_9ACTN|nr:helix-turn-helix domain-containing protein [Nonomuraea phyllanthi]
MSKARVVITAVVVEGRSQAEVARSYGVSKGWVSKLVARYRAEGEAAFEPRSRRPRSSPNAIDADTVELIVRLRKDHALPKALPAGSRDADTHTRVRHDRIDPSGVVTLRLGGRLHHIGIGRTHARTHVILLVDDLHVRVVDAVTGELLRELTIDPTRDYQPQEKPETTKPPNP